VTGPLPAGYEVYLEDVNRCHVARFNWLHEGIWLAIQRPGAFPLAHQLSLPGNGGLGALMLWQNVLEYLCLAGRRNETYCATSVRQMIYLRPVLRASELARLLGRDVDEIRAELADYVIQVID
jgi:hypothetical protein